VIRSAVLGLCLFAATASTAQDANQRPTARPVAQTTAPAEPISPDLPAVRPLSRTPTLEAIVPRQTIPTALLRPNLRPYERPELAQPDPVDPKRGANRIEFDATAQAPAISERPSLRPAAIERAAQERVAAIRRGQVCGDPAIQGDAIGRVSGRGRCGIENAVRVRSVAGVALRPAATIDCGTARALKRWVTSGALPATGGQVSSLRVVSHYACRNRNAASTGRLSEHAFGKAIDIAGIGLKSGREITVLTGWNSSRDSSALRRMWQAACGPFGTVLGPNANRFHRDHFHFDTASYRSGSYCR
jgi:hypothetical protein